MKYSEAIEEMKELAGGKDWALHYQSSSYGGVDIHGYIAGVGSAKSSETYAGAIENVKVMLGLVPCDPAPEDGTDTSRPDPAESER